MIIIVEVGKIIWYKALVLVFNRMVILMMENGSQINNMVLELINLQTEIDMRDFGQKIKDKDRELFISKIKIFTKVIGWMIKDMG